MITATITITPIISTTINNNKENPSLEIQIIQQLIILIRIKQQQLIPINLVEIITQITIDPSSHCNKFTPHNIRIDWIVTFYLYRFVDLKNKLNML